MDSFKLKVFAISVMLIDHIGVVLVSETNNSLLYLICRSIGRLAFPIFAFLIAEGYRHTRDVTKYLKRLLAFALISEIPFDLALYKYQFNTDPITDIRRMFQDVSYSNVVLDNFNQSQNIFFTLFLGLSLIYLFDLVEKKFTKTDFISIIASNTLDGLLTIAFCAIAYILKTDYSIAGILIIVAFYLFRESRILTTISIFVITGTLLCDFQSGNVLNMISILATLAVIPIAFYNGKKGKSIKYFFYAFYPVHLMCLFLIVYFFKFQ